MDGEDRSGISERTVVVYMAVITSLLPWFGRACDATSKGRHAHGIGLSDRMTALPTTACLHLLLLFADARGSTTKWRDSIR